MNPGGAAGIRNWVSAKRQEQALLTAHWHRSGGGPSLPWPRVPGREHHRPLEVPLCGRHSGPGTFLDGLGWWCLPNRTSGPTKLWRVTQRAPVFFCGGTRTRTAPQWTRTGPKKKKSKSKKGAAPQRIARSFQSPGSWLFPSLAMQHRKGGGHLPCHSPLRALRLPCVTLSLSPCHPSLQQLRSQAAHSLLPVRWSFLRTFGHQF